MGYIMLNQCVLGRYILSGLLAGCLAYGLTAGPVHAASKSQINTGVESTMDEFKFQVRGAEEVLKKSKGLLVFPKVYQGGFVLGAEYGEGALLVGGSPVDYYRLTSGSVGFQLGGQRKSIIIAFMTDEALQKFRNSSGWEIGADASAAVLVVGAEGAVSTTTLNQPILAFVIDQKGLMYNLSLEGSKITRIKK